MANKEINKISLDEVVIQKNLSSLIDIVHKFSQDIISAKSESDIFNILTNDVAKQMNFLDCVIYEVDNKKKTLKQTATFGYLKTAKKATGNSLVLKFGQGHSGVVAESGTSLLIPDVDKSSDYLIGKAKVGSELVIPIKIHNEVYAVIRSAHPDKNFYKETHQKLLEVIVSIAEGALVKMHEKAELEKIKLKLEGVLQRKSDDLDKAIDTLSFQYSEMKYQHEKQETLIQEVHHRVTNNLQIISSILRLYINKDETGSTDTLQKIHNRVQVMALIHQNIYKSMEMNLVNINSYLNDLVSFLKSTSKQLYIRSERLVEAEFFSFDVLVPFGLYITEVFSFWVERAEKNDLAEMCFDIELIRSKNDYSFALNIKDKSTVPLPQKIDIDSFEGMSNILISALVDQLDGELNQGFEEGNYIKLKFKALT